MKYIISESRLHQMVFKYLDLKNLKITEVKNDIFFMRNEKDMYSVLRYGIRDNMLFIRIDLYEEISSMFNLSEDDTKQIISSWVESVLGLKVNHIDIWHTNFMFYIHR